MKKIILFGIAYLVTWKAVGMGDKVCDLNEYTGAEVSCEKRDVQHEKWFNTKEGADAFVKAAPSSGIKDMTVVEKEQNTQFGQLIFSGSSR